MKRILLWMLPFAILTSSLLAGDYFAQRNRRGYFFLPPRSIYYYQPDRYQNFYLAFPYPGYRSYASYGYGGYNSPYYPRSYRGYGHYPGRGSYPYQDGYDDHSYSGSEYTGSGVYRVYVQSPVRSQVVRSNMSDLIFRVDPPQALVYVDSKLIGSAGDFATEREKYSLLDGEHDLRIEHPGYESFITQMEIAPNRTLHLDIELKEKD